MKGTLAILFSTLCLCAVAGNGGIRQFPLKDVRLLESPFLAAQQRDAEYIMALDADRLLSPYLREAGLEPKAESYTNWENTGLDGHTGGHYLSALSLMYASTGDEKVLARLNYMLDELQRCQDALGTGYIGGVPGGVAMWEEIRAGNIKAAAFSLNGKWVPLYNIHKVYAGLRDAWLHAGLPRAKDMLVKYADWCVELTQSLSDVRMQDMLRSEHGGLNEVFADVAEITGDEKYLILARRFSHMAILAPLLAGEDKLTGIHANTQIPKVIGYKRIADLEGNHEWDEAAAFFWNTVVENRSVSIGGNSVREHFHPADDFSTMTSDREGPETCNTYNMLRLSAMLFCSTLDEKYVDFYERALYNHILSTQHPGHGGLVYFTSMRPGHYRVYSQPQTSFWCCVGSGMENHAKYGEWIYAHSEDELYVNLFIPSTLEWREKSATVEMQTAFPDSDNVLITVNPRRKSTFTLKIRYPRWAREGVAIKVNGEVMETDSPPGSYISINRTWKKGDRVEIILPMGLELEQIPDKSAFYSFRYGPVVLAAAMGEEDMDDLLADDARMAHVAHGRYIPLDEMPVLAGPPEEILSSVEPVEGKPLTFKVLRGIYPERFEGLELAPFFRLHDSRYAVYFQQSATLEELVAERLRTAAEEAERMETDRRTVDVVYAGEQQPESDHGFASESSQAGLSGDRRWRSATGWFSYRMNTKGEKGLVLRLTCYGLNADRSFDIFVNGEITGSFSPGTGTQGEFHTVDYPLPDTSTETLEVKFMAREGMPTAEIYEIRLMKAPR